MATIIYIDKKTVKILNDGEHLILPFSTVKYKNPRVGDDVLLINSKDGYIVLSGEERESTPLLSDSYHVSINKYWYIIITGFLGVFGVHRFIRRQIGLSIAMLLVAWVTLGLWPLVDFVISIIKLNKYQGKYYVFDKYGKWAKVDR